jgi:uroporphyrin-III C-methyltransferase
MAATTPVERVLVATLATIAERAAADGIVSPALIVVGDIGSMRAELAGTAAEAKSA